jgi:hypothetical protein
VRVRTADPSTELGAVIRFLVINDYPHDWSPDDLGTCTIFKVQDETKATVGYIWLHWRTDLDMTIELHACVARALKGRRWLTPEVARPILSCARWSAPSA